MTTNEKSKICVLVVDDNPKLLDAVTLALETIGGFDVLRAKNGIEGLTQFDEARPDCIIVDVKMPGIDGYQLARAIRGDPATADTPLIMLSAMAQDTDQLIGYASGADQYLIKPVTPEKLVDAIHTAIALSDAERTERLTELARLAEEEGL